MAADPITAVGNAVTEALQLFRPYVDEHFAQLYEKENQERMATYEGILATPSSVGRADALSAFVLRLIASAGSTAGGIPGNIAIPMDVLNQLVALVSLKIKDDQMLARIQFKTTQP